MRGDPTQALRRVRRWTFPRPGESLQDLACRELDGLPLERALEQLRAWNPHLTFNPILARDADSALLPSEIVYLEGALEP